jgi:hypothetical protein
LTDRSPFKAVSPYAAQARELMLQKNHDYGEAWRSMSQESFVDLILMKLPASARSWPTRARP